LRLSETHRTLLVETDSTGGLAAMFSAADLSPQPAVLHGRRLFGVRIRARALVEEYFQSLLRVPALARRLLSSSTFNAVTAAAPGVTEFLILQKLLEWLEPGWSGRTRFQAIVVDGPATGHALKLLSAPRTLASLVPGGPIGQVSRQALKLLADHRATQVVLVALPEELAVTETLEAHDQLVNDLALHVPRPVINRVFRRRFSARDLATIDATTNGTDPLAVAARFEIARRRDAERHIARLRRGLQQQPLSLPMIFTEDLDIENLRQLGRTLARLL
jgi:anion-transporting  ArsA/GET3 family ATPase